MSKDAIDKIADNANMIVNGYAFTKEDNGWISILNLNHPDCAMVIDTNGDLIETNMDEIEQHIVREISLLEGKRIEFPLPLFFVPSVVECTKMVHRLFFYAKKQAEIFKNGTPRKCYIFVKIVCKNHC